MIILEIAFYVNISGFKDMHLHISCRCTIKIVTTIDMTCKTHCMSYGWVSYREILWRSLHECHTRSGTFIDGNRDITIDHSFHGSNFILTLHSRHITFLTFRTLSSLCSHCSLVQTPQTTAIHITNNATSQINGSCVRMRSFPISSYHLLIIRFTRFCLIICRNECINVAWLCIITSYGSCTFGESGNLHILQKRIIALVPVCCIRMSQRTATIHIVNDLTTRHIDSNTTCHISTQSTAKHIVNNTTRHRHSQRMACICIAVCCLITTAIDVTDSIVKGRSCYVIRTVNVNRHLTLRSTIQIITAKDPRHLTTSCGHSDITIDLSFNSIHSRISLSISQSSQTTAIEISDDSSAFQFNLSRVHRWFIGCISPSAICRIPVAGLRISQCTATIYIMQNQTFFHVDGNRFFHRTCFATTEYRTCNQLFGSTTIICIRSRAIIYGYLRLPDMSQIITDTFPSTSGTIHITVTNTIISDASATNRNRRLTASGSRNIIGNISSTHWTHSTSTVHIVYHMTASNIDGSITKHTARQSVISVSLAIGKSMAFWSSSRCIILVSTTTATIDVATIQIVGTCVTFGVGTLCCS